VASQVQFIKLIGIGIAISVVIDATIVRMLLVPAFLVLMGDWNWYMPAWLGAIVDYLGVSDDKILLQDFSGAEPAVAKAELVPADDDLEKH